MYNVILDEPHKLGLEKLTGSNRGLFYINEKMMDFPSDALSDSNSAKQKYQPDVYAVEDARFSDAVKDDVITQQFPRDEEHKILRKTLANIISRLSLVDDAEFAEFKEYNDFVESIKV